MALDQLTGRYRRLKDELARAYAQSPWPTGRIDRLADEISQTEREIAALGAELPAATSQAANSARTDRPSPVEPAPPLTVAKSSSRTPAVARNRLTPFGQHISERARE